MSDCRDFELLASLRASGPGALDAAESARLDAHLVGCAACRAEAAAAASVLDLVRLPAPTEAERRAVAGLAAPTLLALRRTDRRRGLVARLGAFGAVAAVAAAVTLFLLAPAALRKEASPAGPGAGAVAAAGTAAVVEDDAEADDESGLFLDDGDLLALAEESLATADDDGATHDAALDAFDAARPGR